MKTPIYEPKGRAKEYGDLALNIYTGCNHGCSYCFAPAVLRKDRTDFMDVKPRAGIIENVAAQLARGDIIDKTIHLCFTCDPYPADIDTSTTREIIRLIKESGNHVQILTKGGRRAMRDFDLLDKDDRFGVTLSGNGESEPNAAPQYERYETIIAAYWRGIKTWVSFEPVYDPEMVYAFIATGESIDLFKIGKLNHQKSDIDWAAFGFEAKRLCQLYDRNYYIKDDLRLEMEKAVNRKQEEITAKL